MKHNGLGGSYRPHRIVLVGRGDAEQGQHFIAHKLTDDTAVGLDDLHRPILQAAHESLHLLGIELLGHRGVAGEVGEEHSGLAAFTFVGGGCRWLGRKGKWNGEVVSAGIAEPIAGRVLVSAVSARRAKGKAAAAAEFGSFTIFVLTLRTFHDGLLLGAVGTTRSGPYQT